MIFPVLFLGFQASFDAALLIHFEEAATSEKSRASISGEIEEFRNLYDDWELIVNSAVLDTGQRQIRLPNAKIILAPKELAGKA